MSQKLPPPIEPTEEYLRDLKEEIDASWTGRRELDARRKAVVNNTHPIPLPPDLLSIIGPDYEKLIVRSGLGREDINRAAGIFGPRSLQIVEVSGAGSKTADDMERGISALFPMLEKQQQESVDTPKLRDGLTYGRVATELMIHPWRWSSYPMKQKDQTARDYNKARRQYGQDAGLPFMWRLLPAPTVYPVSGETGIADSVVQIIEVSVRELKRYFVLPEKNEWRGQTPLTLMKYANREWLAWMIFDGADGYTGARRDVKENPYVYHHRYGVCPIIYREVCATGDSDPNYRTAGLIDEVLGLIEHIDSLMTQRNIHVVLTHVPTPIMTVRSELDENGKPRDLTWKVGKGLVMWTDESFAFAPIPDLPTDIDAAINQSIQFQDRATFSSAYYGDQAGISSGVMARELLGAGSGKYRSIGDGVAMHDEMEAEVALALVAAWGEDISIFYQGQAEREQVSLKVADAQKRLKVQGTRSIKPPFNPQSDIDAMIRMRTIDPTTKMPFFSMRTVLKMVGMLESPSAEEDQIMTEQMEAIARESEMQDIAQKYKLVKEAQQRQEVQNLLDKINQGSIDPALIQAAQALGLLPGGAGGNGAGMAPTPVTTPIPAEMVPPMAAVNPAITPAQTPPQAQGRQRPPRPSLPRKAGRW